MFYCNNAYGLAEDVSEVFIYYGGTLLSTDGVMDFILNQRFDNNDAASSSRVYRYEISADLVSVEDRKTESPPRDFMLQQSYPNPFNPTTVISYTVPTAAHVKLEIFNIKGEIIQALVDEFKSRGSYSARFDASKFTSGLYFYRLTTGPFQQTRKMILVR
ncbi:MAG TPA: T9SS type A sorting domain-containing protein [bacterium]